MLTFSRVAYRSSDAMTVMNAHDLWVRLDPKPEVALMLRGEQWWPVLNGDTFVRSHRFEGNLPDRSDASDRGFTDFNDARAASGYAGGWKRAEGKLMASLWVPVTYTPPHGLRARKGKAGSKPVRWIEGAPCRWPHVRFLGNVCPNLAVDGDHAGLCRGHRAADDKRRETNERWKADSDQRIEQDRWHREGARRSKEILAELAPLLAELGHRPDTVLVSGGNLSLPAEALRALVFEAVELAEIKDLV